MKALSVEKFTEEYFSFFNFVAWIGDD